MKTRKEESDDRIRMCPARRPRGVARALGRHEAVRLERPVLHMSSMLPFPTGDDSGNLGLAAVIHVLSAGHPDV